MQKDTTDAWISGMHACKHWSPVRISSNNFAFLFVYVFICRNLNVFSHLFLSQHLQISNTYSSSDHTVTQHPLSCGWVHKPIITQSKNELHKIYIYVTVTQLEMPYEKWNYDRGAKHKIADIQYVLVYSSPFISTHEVRSEAVVASIHSLILRTKHSYPY